MLQVKAITKVDIRKLIINSFFGNNEMFKWLYIGLSYFISKSLKTVFLRLNFLKNTSNNISTLFLIASRGIYDINHFCKYHKILKPNDQRIFIFTNNLHHVLSFY